MPRDDYFSIDTIREDGCVAQINAKRRPDGRLAYSFSLFREFERDECGPTMKTVFLGEMHVGPARRLLEAVERRIQEERDKEFSEQRRQRRGA